MSFLQTTTKLLIAKREAKIHEEPEYNSVMLCYTSIGFGIGLEFVFAATVPRERFGMFPRKGLDTFRFSIAAVLENVPNVTTIGKPIQMS